ncbi:carbohydrate ABC transporter permease [Paenibacillus sp. CGMCC 1.16610]|uniref:ABC transporter permease subunit n=1 Tax=Paenibacillus anseongense TaxID=2682845 RepID=A0ABW9U8S1_9BACL|nr:MULTISPECIES: carbohydrate ABC transporter permease [Paenibacillus]MBA2937469.1 carbohydrate ABC transporter permease [Paenibacillus sp. CGMCC 1.16610]MVQ36527.1 ABC transporter permease subunit [Paenibacillus anseongense]
MIRQSLGSRIFDIVNVVVLIAIALITLIPFVFVLSGSLTASEELIRRGVVLIPTKLSLDGYKYIFSTKTILWSLSVTAFITIAGTLINLFFTTLTAYPLARNEFMGRRPIMLLILFTMLFSGGMIPTFLVVKSLGLLNSYGSLLIPGAISAFNLIIIRNFFQQLPDGLEESAKIDGCNDFQILIRIVLPLSLPAMATFALFYAVGHWNTFFNAILYINDTTKWPIQVWLRQIVILSQGGVGDSQQMGSDYVAPPGEVIKMAVIVVSTVPILLVYPFLQKHFAKGVLLGSVKG